MAVIDEVEWHELSESILTTVEFENAGIVIALFFQWILTAGLVGHEFVTDNRAQIDQVISGQLAATTFVSFSMDGQINSDMLTDRGNKFTEHYYATEKFREDLLSLFPEKSNVYQIEETPEARDRVNRWLDARYEEWLRDFE